MAKAAKTYSFYLTEELDGHIEDRLEEAKKAPGAHSMSRSSLVEYLLRKALADEKGDP